MSTTITEAKLLKALNTVAGVLHAPGEKTDRETGKVEQVNLLAYPQKKVLNGLCYSTFLTLKTTEESLDKARAQAKEAASQHRGDEISENRLNSRLDWIETLQEQQAALELVLRIASQVYEQHSGEAFVPPVTKPRVAAEFQTRALSRAQALTGVSREAQQTDGVKTVA